MTTRMIGISMALLAAAVLPAGCGSGGGFLVRPVPAEQRLAESVVSRDRGLLVVDKIAVVDLDGLLENRRHGAFLGDGENPVSLFVEKLDKAQADRAVRAVIVRINSPGGGVTASDIMYQRLMQFRNQSKVPVVAVIEDLGASGGYYVACAADTIFAHRSSVVGSIGAIVQTVSFAGTMSKLGIDAQAVTSGRFKDMASPLKPLDSEDLKILQGMVDEFQKRFAEVVAAGRPKLSVEKVGVLADGRVYTGEQALANGLVDRVGTMDDAIAYAKKLCGGKRMKVVVYHRPLGYRGTVYAASSAPQVNLLNLSLPDGMISVCPKFLYLWTGRRLPDER